MFVVPHLLSAMLNAQEIPLQAANLPTEARLAEAVKPLCEAVVIKAKKKKKKAVTKMAQADEIKTLPPQIQPIWPDARWIKRLKKKKVEIRTSLCFLFPGDLRHPDTAPGSARNRYFGIDINESKGGV